MQINVDLIYPVGSIYMSVNSTSPATLFGGTWTQLKDRFLLGAGSTYTNGAMGGAATHTLTIDEIPSHRHGIDKSGWAEKDGLSDLLKYRSLQDDSKVHLYTDYAGGGKAHNNMPPYLVVYMWKRTK